MVRRTLFLLTLLSIFLSPLYACAQSTWSDCPIETVNECLEQFRALSAPMEQDTALRNYAIAQRLGSHPDVARDVLAEAVEHASKIPEGYDRANSLRYLAEQYYLLGDFQMADTVFDSAMEAASTAIPYFRMLSAYIGIVETARNNGYKEGVRHYGMQVITSGIFTEMAGHQKTGETNRFLTNLDGALYTEDIPIILGKLQLVNWPHYRKRVLYKLGKLEYRGGALDDCVSLKKEISGFSQDKKENALLSQLLMKLNCNNNVVNRTS